MTATSHLVADNFYYGLPREYTQVIPQLLLSASCLSYIHTLELSMTCAKNDTISPTFYPLDRCSQLQSLTINMGLQVSDALPLIVTTISTIASPHFERLALALDIDDLFAFVEPSSDRLWLELNATLSISALRGLKELVFLRADCVSERTAALLRRVMSRRLPTAFARGIIQVRSLQGRDEHLMRYVLWSQEDKLRRDTWTSGSSVDRPWMNHHQIPPRIPSSRLKYPVAPTR